jgi:hypothetical protein
MAVGLHENSRPNLAWEKLGHPGATSRKLSAIKAAEASDSPRSAVWTHALWDTKMESSEGVRRTSCVPIRVDEAVNPPQALTLATSHASRRTGIRCINLKKRSVRKSNPRQ